MHEIKAEVQESSRATNEKLQKMSEVINRRVDDIEVKVSELDEKVNVKFNYLEPKINNIQIQEAPVRVVAESVNRMKAPIFDGSAPFNIFRFQFDTVENRNGWGNEEKAIELILALKRAAADVLETVPVNCTNNYDEIMVALQRKYGGEHKKEIFRMELRGRLQKPNESLQDFSMEIERLVQLSYPGESPSFLDHFNIEAFVNGIRDPDIKLAVCATRKHTFTETVSFALAQEKARLISRPQVHKVRKLEVSDES